MVGQACSGTLLCPLLLPRTADVLVVAQATARVDPGVRPRAKLVRGASDCL